MVCLLRPKNPVITEKTVLILVPVFDRFDSFKALYKDLESQSEQDYHLLMIDHGHRNFSARYDKLSVLKASPDLWFTGAINAGLEYALAHIPSPDRFLILNDDVRLEDRNWLKKMKEACAADRMVSCAAIDSHDRIIYSGIRLNLFKFDYTRLKSGRPKDMLGNESIACDVLPTRGLIFYKSLIDQIGLLSMDLPHYSSDYEWTMRAKSLGVQLCMLNSTVLRTSTSGEKQASLGKRKYKERKLKSFWRDARDPHIKGSFPNVFMFSKKVFRCPYRYFFNAYQVVRKTVGFLVTNYC